MPQDPFERVNRLQRIEDYERLEDRVAAQGEALLIMNEALRALRDEVVRLRRGDPPAGAVARY
jgi:hypothetical protein